MYPDSCYDLLLVCDFPYQTNLRSQEMTLVVSVLNTFVREKTKGGCLVCEDIRASSTFGRVLVPDSMITPS